MKKKKKKKEGRMKVEKCFLRFVVFLFWLVFLWWDPFVVVDLLLLLLKPILSSPFVHPSVFSPGRPQQEGLFRFCFIRSCLTRVFLPIHIYHYIYLKF